MTGDYDKKALALLQSEKDESTIYKAESIIGESSGYKIYCRFRIDDCW